VHQRPGPSVQHLLDRECRPVPVALRHEHQEPLDGVDAVDPARYWSYDVHRLEVERLWRRVWQVACREEDIPGVGDHEVYDIVDDSVIVVRTDDGTIRAFHNVCLHRGTKLRVDAGHAASFRCPFHGFTWNLDGSLKQIPSAWDFPQVDPATFSLPEVHVATWGGFVFVNLATEPEPFDSFLEVLPEQFRSWRLEQRWSSFHAAKVIPCNWKVALEAFLESYHVIATHPQILPSTGDANTQYDTWGRHVNRMITPFAVASPHLRQVAEQQVADNATELFRRLVPDGLAVPEGSTARETVGDFVRTGMSAAMGVDLSAATDCELLDAIQYHLFPNFVPWAGITQSLCYRVRPNGDDPQSCVMDVWRLAPVPDGAPRPPAARAQHLGVDQPWTDAKGMGGLADVFEQDMANLPRVQAGLRAARRPVVFARYQESRLRQLHHTLGRYLDDGPPEHDLPDHDLEA
jgi:nitrite reductase/ring-hydroxylating ferredoxin subunit